MVIYVKYFIYVNFIELVKIKCYHKNENRRTSEMKGRVKAIDVAKWFVWKTHMEQLENIYEDDDYEVYEGITHLKVQKLLYYAQGINLAVHNAPLFKENIVAWQHGPVVKEVYKILCNYGRNDIEFKDEWFNTIEKIEKDDELSEILNITYENYGGYTAWQLREKTHIAGGPWEKTVDSKGMDRVIDNDLIKNYFQKNIVSNG